MVSTFSVKCLNYINRAVGGQIGFEMPVKIDTATLAARWATLHFFPSRIERLLARYWPVSLFILFSPLIIVPWFVTGSLREHLFLTWHLISIGFISSLIGACVLAGAAVAFWERTFRETFGNAVRDGIVREDADCLREYLNLSEQIEVLMGSHWRYALWLGFVAFMVIVNRSFILDVFNYIRHPQTINGTFYEDIAILPVQFLVTYVAGAISWALIASAIWISRLSKSSCLQLQPGHSDNCCGLANVGLCSLQAALPLLVGMILLFLWGNGSHLPWLVVHVNSDFLLFIRSYVLSLLVALFVLACALVFLPVISLHKRMRAYKSHQDKEYSDLLREQCELSRDALPANEEAKTKFLADRLKLVQSFDPISLRLSTWPFDRKALVTYGITPILTVLASIVKSLLSKGPVGQ